VNVSQFLHILQSSMATVFGMGFYDFALSVLEGVVVVQHAGLKDGLAFLGFVHVAAAFDFLDTLVFQLLDLRGWFDHICGLIAVTLVSLVVVFDLGLF
jgi:uncharacterized membrane protein